MYYDKDENVYVCPKCERMITEYDVKLGRCVVCDLDISSISEDLSMIQEETLIETFASEIKKGDRKIHYYDTAINILKAYLVNVLCVRKKMRTAFHYVEDKEVKFFLFRLRNNVSNIYMEFDYMPNYKGVRKYSERRQRLGNFGGIRSFIILTDFQKMMDLAMAIYSTKKLSCSKEFAPTANLYRFRK